jgi:argininosuccinate lyase
MPQKRNPYALVVIRGGARTLLGRATGVLATQLTPSGRTDNLLYAYGEVAGSVELATRLLDLAAATAASLTFAGVELPADALATDAAERLSIEQGLDYRAAYRRVGRDVAAGNPPAEDPREAVATRTVTGGAAPAPMRAMLEECRTAIAHARDAIARERAQIEAAEAKLLAMTE